MRTSPRHAGPLPGVRHAGSCRSGIMKRRVLNLLTALSLLLCVAVCVLWVRSYRVADVFERSRWFPDFSAREFRG